MSWFKEKEIEIEYGPYEKYMKCNECDEISGSTLHNICPECGSSDTVNVIARKRFIYEESFFLGFRREAGFQIRKD